MTLTSFRLTIPESVKATVIDSPLLYWFPIFLFIFTRYAFFNFLTSIIIYAKIFAIKYKYESAPKVPFSQRRSLDQAGKAFS